MTAETCNDNDNDSDSDDDDDDGDGDGNRNCSSNAVWGRFDLAQGQNDKE
jgi:hypothetical protein